MVVVTTGLDLQKEKFQDYLEQRRKSHFFVSKIHDD